MLVATDNIMNSNLPGHQRSMPTWKDTQCWEEMYTYYILVGLTELYQNSSMPYKMLCDSCQGMEERKVVVAWIIVEYNGV